jgi:putative two-component system response regulator
VASLASALRMPSLPLYDAWSHLVRLTEQASWVEDTSGGHPQRTARLAELLAETIGLDAHERGVVQRAGLIHDVGLSAFPIGLLQCGERSAREAQLYDSHAAISADFIARSNIPCSSQIADAVRHHLQPYDGQGGALVGEQLPLYARIIAIANAFDEMTHDRPGRPATPVRGALKDILRQRGREFDPQLVDRFIELVRQIEREHGNVLAYLSSAAGKT